MMCKRVFYLYLYRQESTNYVNALMPIFCQQFDLMHSVMSFTAEFVFVGVLLPYHVLIKVIHYGIIIENDLFCDCF